MNMSPNTSKRKFGSCPPCMVSCAVTVLLFWGLSHLIPQAWFIHRLTVWATLLLAGVLVLHVIFLVFFTLSSKKVKD